MAFRVEILPQAFADIDSIAGYLKDHGNTAVAERWFNGIMDEIASLKDMPGRSLIAPESEEVGQEVRVLLYGRRNRSYKIYYSIHLTSPTRGTVRVLHIRHWARRPPSGEELQA